MSCCGHCAEVLTTDYRTPAARKGKNMKNVKGTKNVQNSGNYSNHSNRYNRYNNQSKSSHGGSQDTHTSNTHIDFTSPVTLARMFDFGHKPKVVYICAPYRPLSKDPEKAAAELKENIRNTRMACTLVSIMNEMPVSSALMYPQFLNDDDPIDRKKGIDYGIRLLESADELWIVGDRITAGMRQEIDAAKELQIPIRLMGNPYDEAEKLLQLLDELEKCIPDEDESATGADDDDDDTADDSDSTEDADEELDDSRRDHVQGVFDCLMCPCSGIDSPDEFLENFEHYFWTGFPECKADEDDQDDPEDFDDEDGCSGNDDEDNEGADDETEDDEDDEDSSDNFDDFLTDIIDALETVRDLYGKED